MNTNGEVIRNDGRLICKGNSKVEGIYFENNFSLVARKKSIRTFLAFFIYNFKVYQMDVNSTNYWMDILKKIFTLNNWMVFNYEKIQKWYANSRKLPNLSIQSWIGIYYSKTSRKVTYVHSNLYFKIKEDILLIALVYVFDRKK